MTIIEAQEFRLTDQAGNIRAMLRLDEAGRPALTLHDTADKARVLLDLSGDSPGLTLFDSAGNLRASLVLSADGSPRLGFADGQENLVWRAP